MKKFIALLLITLFLPLTSFSQEDSQSIDLDAMLKDVKSVVKQKNGDDLWHSDVITNIVKKHVPLGMDKSEIFRLLDNKKINHRRTEEKYRSIKDGDESYTASTDFWLFPYFLFFDHTFVLFLEFKDEKLIKVRGKVKWNVL